MEILEGEGRAAVADLALRLGVNEETIRRDLRELKEQGLIRKTHGGALRKIATAPPYETRLTQAADVKEAIGRRAAEMVKEGDSILIDSGTTTLCLARALTVRRARIITNSLEIARALVHRSDYELIILGGRYDQLHHEISGNATVDQLLRYRVDRLFMGMTAIDRENGITDVAETDAAVKRTMMRVSRRIIGLADHNKIGQMSCHWVAPASALDILITDEFADCSSFADLDWDLIQVGLEHAVAREKP